MSAVENAERELELAKTAEAYDAAVETYRNSGSDEDKATKDELAEQVVALRRAIRLDREQQDAALASAESNGDAVARPQPIDGTTGVN